MPVSEEIRKIETEIDDAIRSLPIWRAPEVFVDALKMASCDRVDITLDLAARTITVFEGGNRTGFDNQLVSFQHLTQPLRTQNPLVDDRDQLTSRWSAGIFRTATRSLVGFAMQAEQTVRYGTMPLFRRPTVFEVPPQIYDAHKAVFDDITLDATQMEIENVARHSSHLSGYEHLRCFE